MATSRTPRRRFTVFNVVAARPNFPKVAPIDRAMRESDRFRSVLVHTGQHYDFAMSDAFIQDLGMPAPEHHLGIGSGSHGEQTAEALKRFELLLLADRPDMVLVVGDVNSTLACALACSKIGVPVAHVEAGLRSFDRAMPEEVNRIVTDVLSDLLFVTEPVGVRFLRKEGVAKSKIHLVGDVMIDTLRATLPKAREIAIAKELGVATAPYAVLTLHRPANVDDPARLAKLVGLVESAARLVPVVFPVHPRTRKRLEETGLAGRVAASSRVRMIEPLGYLRFLSLLDGAALAITDSGGVPEECTFLGIPCVTLRDTTERPLTIEHGINTLVGDSEKKAVAAVKKALARKGKRKAPPRGWDGRTANRILKVIDRFLSARERNTARTTRKNAA